MDSEGGRLKILLLLVGFGSPYPYCVIENGCFITLFVLTEATKFLLLFIYLFIILYIYIYILNSIVQLDINELFVNLEFLSHV